MNWNGAEKNLLFSDSLCISSIYNFGAQIQAFMLHECRIQKWLPRGIYYTLNDLKFKVMLEFNKNLLHVLRHSSLRMCMQVSEGTWTSGN